MLNLLKLLIYYPIIQCLLLINIFNINAQEQVAKSLPYENYENHTSPTITELEQAEIIILNKITAKSIRKLFKLGEKHIFGNLTIQVERCVKNHDLFNANNIALINIHDDKEQSIFYGWIFSSNLSISNIEHPVYELMVIDCQKIIN